MLEAYSILADLRIHDNPETYLALNSESTFEFITNQYVIFGYAKVISEQLSVVTGSGPVPQSDEEWNSLKAELNEKISKAGYVLEVNADPQ